MSSESYLDAAAEFYREAALDPQEQLCCTTTCCPESAAVALHVSILSCGAAAWLSLRRWYLSAAAAT